MQEQSAQDGHEIPTQLTDYLTETADLHEFGRHQEKHTDRWNPEIVQI